MPPPARRPRRSALPSTAALALACLLALSVCVSRAQAETSHPASTEPAPLIDYNTTTLWCGFGAAMGVMIMAVPPLISWAHYEAALTGSFALVKRTGLGCYFGLLGGLATSVVSGTIQRAQYLVHQWLGRPPEISPDHGPPAGADARPPATP